MPAKRCFIANVLVNCLRGLAAGLFVLLALHANAVAVELGLDEVRAALGDEVREITVKEPHMKCGRDGCTVTYVGIPLEKLMQHYFPDTWKGFNGVIHFSARDGYLAAVDTNKVRDHDAYLTFSRADGKPFIIDNVRQNEQNVPLGPFYLVWGNLKDPELQKQGAYGWPYQVVEMELLPSTVYDRLLPADASPAVREGFEDWKTYCMACHQIDGIGGMKNPVDLRYLLRGKSREVLRAWISCPDSLRPGTTMPPLNVNLDSRERRQVTERILDYLESLQQNLPDSNTGNNGR